MARHAGHELYLYPTIQPRTAFTYFAPQLSMHKLHIPIHGAVFVLYSCLQGPAALCCYVSR